MVKAKRKDGSVVHRPDSACKGCYDSTYRPNLRVKISKRSNHEKGLRHELFPRKAVNTN